MANWVKFSERLPKEKDCDGAGALFVMDEHGDRDTISISYTELNAELFEDQFWLENVPDMPEPRTLEDVVEEYLSINVRDVGDRRHRMNLEKEMREILERSGNE